jgi:hypothetical protein
VTWKKELILGIRPYSIVGTGEELQGRLLSLYQVVGMQHGRIRLQSIRKQSLI